MSLPAMDDFDPLQDFDPLHNPDDDFLARPRDPSPLPSTPFNVFELLSFGGSEVGSADGASPTRVLRNATESDDETLESRNRQLRPSPPREGSFRLGSLDMRFAGLGEDDYASAALGEHGFASKFSPQSQSLMSFFSSPAAHSERRVSIPSSPLPLPGDSADEDAGPDGDFPKLLHLSPTPDRISVASGSVPHSVSAQKPPKPPAGNAGSGLMRARRNSQPAGAALPPSSSSDDLAPAPESPAAVRRRLFDDSGAEGSSEPEAVSPLPRGSGDPLASPSEDEGDDDDPEACGFSSKPQIQNRFSPDPSEEVDEEADEDPRARRSSGIQRSISFSSNTPYSSFSQSHSISRADPYGSVSSVGSLFSTSMSTFSEAMGVMHSYPSSCAAVVHQPEFQRPPDAELTQAAPAASASTYSSPLMPTAEPSTPAIRPEIVLHAIQRFGMASSKGGRTNQENHSFAYPHFHAQPFGARSQDYWNPDLPWPVLTRPGARSPAEACAPGDKSASPSEAARVVAVPVDEPTADPGELEVIDCASDNPLRSVCEVVLGPGLLVPTADLPPQPWPSETGPNGTSRAASQPAFSFDVAPSAASAASVLGPDSHASPRFPSSPEAEVSPPALVLLAKSLSSSALPSSCSLPSMPAISRLPPGAAEASRSLAPTPKPVPGSRVPVRARLPGLLADAVEQEASQELRDSPPGSLFVCSLGPDHDCAGHSPFPSPPLGRGPSALDSDSSSADAEGCAAPPEARAGSPTLWTPQPPSVGLFGVFDGHGGGDCSEFVSRRLGEILLSHPNLQLILASGWFSFSAPDRERARRVHVGRYVRTLPAAEARMYELPEPWSEEPLLPSLEPFFPVSGPEAPTRCNSSETADRDQDGAEAAAEEEEEEGTTAAGRFRVSREPSMDSSCRPSLEAVLERTLVREVSAILRDSFLLVERLWLAVAQESGNYAGSTAAVVLVCGRRLWVANIGDSEVVLSENGAARSLTTVHSVKSNEAEVERVRAAGGRLVNGRVGHPGLDSLYSSVAVSRDLGNLLFKVGSGRLSGANTGIVAQPHISSLRLSEQAEFLIIACDGLWDVLEPQKAVSAVHALVQKRRNSRQGSYEPVAGNSEVSEAQIRYSMSQEELDGISKFMVQYARKRGSRDNITTMLIPLSIL